MIPLDSLAAVVVFTLTSLLLYNYLRKPRTLPLPPGPKGLPFIRNLLDIPIKDQYLTFTQWGKEYGDVVYVNALGNHLIILNSDTAAKELLDGRSAIYSSRPYIPMVHESSLIDQKDAFPFKPYGPDWRRERRMFSQYLGRNVSETYYDTQTAAAHSFLRTVLDDPHRLAAHLRHAAAETILAVAYGYQIQKTNDPYVEMAEYSMKATTNAILPGRYLVNVFPSLKYIPAWVPGAGFKRHARLAKAAAQRAIDTPFEDARKRIAEGTAKPSFVTSAIADSSTPDLLLSIKNIAATMYGAGGDTTSSVMHSCILALVLYPEIQSRAQAELDAVIGPPTSSAFRLPTYEDRPRLLYIDAIVKEGLRWLPTAPIGIPHALTQDDEYRGWRIPKGSTVIANAWSMLRDERIYPHPLVFRPERFLGDNPAPHPISNGCFGFGRRECPGRYVAEATAWIVIANLLAAFTVSAAKDKDGRIIDVNYAREPPSGLAIHPQEFPCIIKSRSPEAEKRIRETRTEDDY